MDFEEGEGEGAALIGSGGPISDVFALSTPLPAKRGVGFAGYDEPKEEPKQPSPKKKAVVIRTYSDSSHEASSKAGSSVASSHALGASLMAANGLGLTILQRDEWTTKEKAQREKVLPVLRQTVSQIDGRIKPKFPSTKAATAAQNMEDFGKLFYEELFEQAPDLKDDVFSSKPPDVLAIKLGLILSELIRLLEMESPRELGGIITEMGLRHIGYGLRQEHIIPFRDVMVDALKKAVTNKGHKWKSSTTKAWNWAIGEVAGLIMEAVKNGGPLIAALQRSWEFLCERMYDESINPQARRSSVGTRGPAYEPYPGYVPPSKQVKAPPPDKPTKKSTQAKAPPPEAPKKEEVKSEAGDEDGQAPAANNPVAALQESTLSLVLAAYKAGGLRKALRTFANAGKDAAGHSETFALWSKKGGSNSKPEYLAGRLATGKRFLDTFAAQNPWAVQEFEFGLKPSHAAKMGEALELIVTSATKPQVLQHKLRVLSLGHVQMGIKPEMFSTFERALFSFLNEALGRYHMFNKETEEAWKWMWGIINSAFTRHMVASAQVLSVMEASWDRIQHTCDLHELSDKFFDNLFRTLPELQSMFTKPKKMQFIMFAKALDLLVRSVSDAKVMDIDVKAIAMRHIKFDIRSEHLDMFGQILLQTLGDAAGPGNWDENDAAAWQDIYSHVAGVFGHVISTGRNLVSKALATGDVEQLRTALGVASRRRRVLAALEIDVDDSVISPLVWSIQEGQLQVANAILEDVLAIRGDRDNYYYGRSVLWNRHPWIVQLLVEKAPNLLSTFLDGHMWTSRFLENGHRRVNYYIQELYGDPRASQNAKMVFTPLGVLVRRLPDAQIYIFAHPTIQFVVDLKWEQFAKQRFVIEQSANLATLVLGMAFMQMGVDRPGVTFGLATAQVAIACIRMALVLWKSLRLLLNGTTPKWNLGGLKLPVPHFLADAFIFFNFVSCAMVTAFYFVTMDVDPFNWKLVLQGSSHQSDEEWIATHDGKKLEAWSTLAAFTTGLLWLQMVEAFKLTTKLSALLFSLTAVISDVLRFILVLGVWAAGFSLIIYWLFVGGNLRDGAEIHDALHVDLGVEGYSDAGTLVFYVVMSCLGLTGIQFIMEASWIIRAVYALCVITTVIVILNLLVSTMVSTYESLNRSFHELAVKTRAEIVVRAEAGLSFPRRCKYFDQCKFNEKVPFDEADDGPSGGVQVVLSAREMGHKAFRVLDRVERYAGSSDPESPWKQDDMLSGAVATGDIHGGNGAGSTSNNRVLRAIDTELSRLGSEIYTLKSSLIKQDDDASSAGKSSALEGDEDGAAKEHAEAEHTSTRDDAADGASKVGSDRNHEEADEQPSPGKLRIVQYAELRAHSSEASFWMVIDGIVRDATSLLGYHPGGKEVLLQQAGMDASAAFHEAHKGPSRTIASAMLKNIPAVGRLQSLESAVPLPGAVGSFQPAPSRPAVPPIPGFHEALKLQGAATSVTSILRSGDGPLTGIMHTSRDVALDF